MCKSFVPSAVTPNADRKCSACGRCVNCERQYTAFCTEVNPGFAGGAYGVSLLFSRSNQLLTVMLSIVST